MGCRVQVAGCRLQVAGKIRFNLEFRFIVILVSNLNFTCHGEERTICTLFVFWFLVLSIQILYLIF